MTMQHTQHLNSVQRHTISAAARYIILILVGIIMVYPLIWMIGATFKSNTEIFSELSFIPKNPTLEGYIEAVKGYGGDIDLFKSMLNTYTIVIPKVIFTLVSATLTAYGFARFNFKGKGVLFAVLMSTLFLPQVVLNVPQYILYNQFGWINSPWYLALIVPALFATDTYFVFMLIQFLRGIPRAMEEAAEIDGCNSFKTLLYIVVPMLKPSLISCALFQFLWTSNDFMGPLLYVSSPAKYTASIFIKMSMDADTGFNWNRILAASLISVIPSLVVFFLAQDQFIDGIAAGGVKG